MFMFKNKVHFSFHPKTYLKYYIEIHIKIIELYYLANFYFIIFRKN